MRVGGGVRIRAAGKLNLSLVVLGRRGDGYHELDTVMGTVGLYDELLIRGWGASVGGVGRGAGEQENRRAVPQAGCPRHGGIEFRCEGGGAPAGGENLVVLAGERLRAEGERMGAKGLGAEIVLKKRIAMGGGLGGGSSDAAAALAGLNRVWGLGVSRERLGARRGSWVRTRRSF